MTDKNALCTDKKRDEWGGGRGSEGTRERIGREKKRINFTRFAHSEWEGSRALCHVNQSIGLRGRWSPRAFNLICIVNVFMTTTIGQRTEKVLSY